MSSNLKWKGNIVFGLDRYLCDFFYFFCCTISLDPVGGFSWNLLRYIIWTCLRAYQILVTSSLSRLQNFKDCQILAKNGMCTFSLWNRLIDLGQTYVDTALWQCEELIRVWWSWPHFQVSMWLKNVRGRVTSVFQGVPTRGIIWCKNSENCSKVWPLLSSFLNCIYFC